MISILFYSILFYSIILYYIILYYIMLYYIIYYRSEGFPNGIFHPCALWDRALARWESCRHVVGVGVIRKFRSTFRPGNYVWRFSHGFGLLVRDLGEWRPGFCTESRCASREHSGLAWGAIFEKVIQNEEIHTF